MVWARHVYIGAWGQRAENHTGIHSRPNAHTPHHTMPHTTPTRNPPPQPDHHTAYHATPQAAPHHICCHAKWSKCLFLPASFLQSNCETTGCHDVLRWSCQRCPLNLSKFFLHASATTAAQTSVLVVCDICTRDLFSFFKPWGSLCLRILSAIGPSNGVRNKGGVFALVPPRTSHLEEVSRAATYSVMASDCQFDSWNMLEILVKHVGKFAVHIQAFNKSNTARLQQAAMNNLGVLMTFFAILIPCYHVYFLQIVRNC